MAISKRAGFACAAGACVALTATAFAGGPAGDGPFNALELPGVPFSTSGSTLGGFTDQFDLVCPFSGSTSPDVWYAYTPDADGSIAAEVCDSDYDTKLYILDSGFNEVACNDDACGSDGFKSQLISPTLTGGQDYFLVVDGFGGEAGNYNLTVEAGPTCPTCEDATPEDEGGLCDETADTNGGCNASPFVIQDVSCGDSICGTAWADAALRDTDWFRLPALGGDSVITYSGIADFTLVHGYLGEDPDCATLTAFEQVQVLAPNACGQLTATAAGDTWWFAGQNVFEGFPCTADTITYVVGWDCVEDTTCPTLGDLNLDSVVDFNDLLVVLSNFGPCP